MLGMLIAILHFNDVAARRSFTGERQVLLVTPLRSGERFSVASASIVVIDRAAPE